MDKDFIGAKIALFAPDGGVLCYLRDDFPGLPHAGRWDLPGGAREAGESPQTCVLRELEEEFGLCLPPSRLEWAHRLPSMLWPDRFAWAFGGRIDPSDINAIRFGDEGQCWQVMAWDRFLADPLVIPDMRARAVMARAAIGIPG